MCLRTCYFLYQMFSCCFALMENIYLFFKSKFKSCLVFEVFSAFPGQRGPCLLSATRYLYMLLLWHCYFGMVEEFPKSKDETKNRCFLPVEERKNRDSHCKIKPESKEFLPLISQNGGRVQCPPC